MIVLQTVPTRNSTLGSVDGYIQSGPNGAHIYTSGGSIQVGSSSDPNVYITNIGIPGGVVTTDGSGKLTSISGTSGQVLSSNGSSPPSWVSAPPSSILGGATGQIPYQTAPSTTAFVGGTGSSGVLMSYGTSVGFSQTPALTSVHVTGGFSATSSSGSNLTLTQTSIATDNLVKFISQAVGSTINSTVGITLTGDMVVSNTTSGQNAILKSVDGYVSSGPTGCFITSGATIQVGASSDPNVYISSVSTPGGVVTTDGSGKLISIAGTSGQVLASNGASPPSWVTSPPSSVLGGAAGQIPYQTGSSTTAFVGGTGTSGVLRSYGASPPQFTQDVLLHSVSCVPVSGQGLYVNQTTANNAIYISQIGAAPAINLYSTSTSQGGINLQNGSSSPGISITALTGSTGPGISVNTSGTSATCMSLTGVNPLQITCTGGPSILTTIPTGQIYNAFFDQSDSETANYIAFQQQGTPYNLSYIGQDALVLVSGTTYAGGDLRVKSQSKGVILDGQDIQLLAPALSTTSTKPLAITSNGTLALGSGTRIPTFTNYGTPGTFSYTPPSGCVYFEVWVTGGGGGGGNANFTTPGSGGGGGGTIYALIPADYQSIYYGTVGAGGLHADGTGSSFYNNTTGSPNAFTLSGGPGLVGTDATDSNAGAPGGASCTYLTPFQYQTFLGGRGLAYALFGGSGGTSYYTGTTNVAGVDGGGGC